MSFLLTCKIQIDRYEFNFANSIEIVSSWKELSDKCTLKLPSKAVLSIADITTIDNRKVQQAFTFEDKFKTGMPVSVWLGYEGENNLEFTGYISEIKPKLPFEIVCEDELYNLKRQPAISGAYSGTLKGILQKYFPTSNLSDKIPDVLLSNFIMDKITPAQLLQKLKEHYGLCAYFRGKTLFVGLPYSEFDSYTPLKYYFQRNVIGGTDDLAYHKKEDMKIKVKAISILKDNTKIEVEAGDAEGETRTLHTYNEPDKAKLKAWAESKLNLLKFEGYSGTFDAFGVPFPKHSGAVALYDERYAERNGQQYLIDKVTTTWGTGGFHRKIEIGQIISNKKL